MSCHEGSAPRAPGSSVNVSADQKVQSRLMPAATTTAPTRPKTKNGSPRKKGLKKKPTAVSKYEEELAFERTISRILLHRFEYDVARLFSTHIHRVAESHLPRLIMSALQIAPPGWVALNANTEEVKDCELPTYNMQAYNAEGAI